MGWTLCRAVPSVLTLVGLVLAFLSLVMIGEGRFEAAVWLILGAGLADTFDGAVARGLGVISGFGSQLDSLVDLVAAGVAPGLLVYMLYFEQWGFFGVLVASSWVGFVAARLARFNTSPSKDPLHFAGIPCPMAATMVAQYVLFSRATFQDDGQAWVMALIVVSLGVLMLSNVPYPKSANLMPRNITKHPWGPAGIAATAAASIVFPYQALFVGVTLSFLVVVVSYLVRPLGGAGARAVVIAPRESPRTG